MDVEALSLEAREAVRNGSESFADGPEMIEAFLQAEVAQIVGTKFIAQVAGELFVLFEKGVLPVGAENVMAVLDLIDDGGEFSVQPLVEPNAENLADAIGRQTPQADFAASLEDLVNGEMAFEHPGPAFWESAPAERLTFSVPDALRVNSRAVNAGIHPPCVGEDNDPRCGTTIGHLSSVPRTFAARSQA